MLYGGAFLRLVPQYRTLWLRGRFGGGKTSLAVSIAHWLLDMGMVDRVWANIPVADAEPPTPETARNCAIVFDESWLMLDSRDFTKNEVKVWGAFLRKWNIYLILPSVWAVDVRFRAMFVERAAAFGTRLWVYRYGVELGYTRETGIVWWWNPRESFGTYDSYYAPVGDGGILSALKEAIARLGDEQEAIPYLKSGGAEQAERGSGLVGQDTAVPIDQYSGSPDRRANYPL